MATQPIIVPDLGDFANVDVIEVLVKAGDSVKKEDSLITLETDKASMDVPAPADGVIATLTVKVGDKVSAGDTIGTLDSAGGASAAAAANRRQHHSTSTAIFQSSMIPAMRRRYCAFVVRQRPSRILKSKRILSPS